MTAREITSRLNISRARLNQLNKYLDEKDYSVIHKRLFIYRESAFRKLAKRQKKNKKYCLKNNT